MKYIFSLLLLFLPSLWALPIGNPAIPELFPNGMFSDCVPACGYCNIFDLFTFEFGFYGDYVFNRHLKVHQHDIASSTIQNTTITTNAGYLGVSFCDRYEVFGTLGATAIHLRSPSSTFGAALNETLLLETNTSFSWSVGGRVLIVEICNFALGFEGQYFQTRPKLNWIKEEMEAYVYFDDRRLKYQEWQLGLALSYHMTLLCDALAIIPYIGVKYAEAKFDLNFTSGIPGATALFFPNLRNDRRWGYAVGATLVACKMWSVTVEGRWLDEKALYVGSILSF